MLQTSFGENLHLAPLPKGWVNNDWFFFVTGWAVPLNGKFSLKQNLQVPDVISDSSVLIVNIFFQVHDMKFESISLSTSREYIKKFY